MSTKPLEKVNILPDRSPSPQTAAVVPANADSIMAIITNAARDPNVDVDKIERLAGLYERMTERAAEQAFNDAMAKAQEEMPRILRDAENGATNSRYARLETINARIGPVIAKHGFSMSFGTADTPMENHYRVTCHLSHVGGHSRDYHADVPSDTVGAKGNANKTPTHGFGSTMSYGRRYLTLLIFNIALVNEDDDARAATGGGAITQEQADQLRDALEAKNAPLHQFLRWAKVDRLEDISADNFKACADAIANYDAGRK